VYSAQGPFNAAFTRVRHVARERIATERTSDLTAGGSMVHGHPGCGCQAPALPVRDRALAPQGAFWRAKASEAGLSPRAMARPACVSSAGYAGRSPPRGTPVTADVLCARRTRAARTAAPGGTPVRGGTPSAEPSSSQKAWVRRRQGHAARGGSGGQGRRQRHRRCKRITCRPRRQSLPSASLGDLTQNVTGHRARWRGRAAVRYRPCRRFGTHAGNRAPRSHAPARAHRT
jgi:hypothetical protein